MGNIYLNTGNAMNGGMGKKTRAKTYSRVLLLNVKQIQHRNLTVSYLLDRPTNTRTHTHTQEMVADAFNKDFNSEGQMS